MEPVVRTRRGTVLRRSKLGVGKKMGSAIYFHRHYTPRWALQLCPPDFTPNVVKVDPPWVSFVECPGFDLEDEPAIYRIATVHRLTNKLRWRDMNGQVIYHHKWLFVKDDYTGFDVAASVERSRLWLALDGVNMSRIGNRTYWESQVLPRLEKA